MYVLGKQFDCTLCCAISRISLYQKLYFLNALIDCALNSQPQWCKVSQDWVLARFRALLAVSSHQTPTAWKWAWKNVVYSSPSTVHTKLIPPRHDAICISHFSLTCIIRAHNARTLRETRNDMKNGADGDRVVVHSFLCNSTKKKTKFQQHAPICSSPNCCVW